MMQSDGNAAELIHGYRWLLHVRQLQVFTVGEELKGGMAAAWQTAHELTDREVGQGGAQRLCFPAVS